MKGETMARSKKAEIQQEQTREIALQFDNVLDRIKEISVAQNFTESLALADAYMQLTQLMMQPAIEQRIMALKDRPIGFLTDRSPDIIRSAQRDNRKIVPYSYQDIAECCVEAMAAGYRITGNEFNIISKRMYPAKNGKFRRIVENPQVTGFRFANTSPMYDVADTASKETKRGAAVQYAKVQCFAEWQQDENTVTLGHDEKDKLIFLIRVNAYMGEDAIIGKALSKLFSRVLLRIEGNVVPDATEIVPGDDHLSIPEAFSDRTEQEKIEAPETPEQSVSTDVEVESVEPDQSEKLMIRFNEMFYAEAEKIGVTGEFLNRFIQDGEKDWGTDFDTILERAMATKQAFTEFLDLYKAYEDIRRAKKPADSIAKTGNKENAVTGAYDSKGGAANVDSAASDEVEKNGKVENGEKFTKKALIDQLEVLKGKYPKPFLTRTKGFSLENKSIKELTEIRDEILKQTNRSDGEF
jgi:hypothetical protein